MRRANRKGYGQTMIIRKKHILFTAFTILITCFTVILVQAKVSAYDYKQGENSVIDKIVNKNAHTATKSFKESIELLDLIDHGAKYLISDDDGCTVPMPNTIINGSGDHSPTLSCYEFFVGKGNEWSGIMDFPKFESNVTTPQTIANYVRGFGYTENSLGSTEAKVETKCLYAIVENSSGGGSGSSTEKYNTDQVCVDIHPVTKHLGSPRNDITSEDSSRDIDITYDNVGGNEFKITYGKEGNSGYYHFEVDNDEQGLLDITWADFVNEWKDLAKKISYAQVTIVEDDSLVDHETVFYKGTSAAIVGEILGTPYASPLSTAEVYNIYNQYLNDDSNVTLKCSDTFDFKNDKNNEWYQVKVKRDGKIDNTCWATDVQKSNSMLYTGANPVASSYNPQTGQDSSAGQYYFTRENMRLKDIVNQINGFDLETILNDISDADASDWSYTAPNSQPNGDNVTCMNSGGAESLGWIVCPVLNWLKNAATEVYENALEPALQVEPKLFTESGRGTEQAWSFFQGMANTLFVILFLFVIFSQLTGVGIDNYGIKKIMPKLVVVAVLINLSYLICVICVDLSNIVGNGLQNLFDSLPTGSPDASVSAALGSGAGATAITAVILLAGLGGGALVIWEKPAILISLLVGALGVVIAIFFVFILLAAREAAIIVLTVISPLAFACYMLPNTKKAFDKWLKFWEGLLLLYPICGALIGGGNFVSNLLLSAGIATQGFWSALTAMLVGIIPIFFIPTALKGAFAAMGTIGSKITGFGDRVRGGATKGLRSSEAYKNMQERGRETGIRRKAGYDKNGNKKDLNRFQRFIRGGRRNVQRNALAYQKLQSEKGALAATEGKDFMLETETANEMKDIVSSGDINDINKLQTGLQGALLANDRAKIRAYSDALFSKKEEGNKSAKAAYNAAVGAGADPEAMRTWANNVMQNHAGLKKDHGSLFAAAQGIVSGGAAQSTGDYLSTADPTTGLTGQAALAGKVSKASIGSMDDASFEEIFGGYNSNSPVSIPTGADAQAIGETAYNAIRENPDMNSKRLGYLRQLVTASGYSPDTQTVQFGAGSQEMNALNQTAASTERTANGVDAVNTQLQQMHRLSGAQLDAKMAQLDDQTIGEIASDPQLSNNDPIVQAAQREYTRRDRERGPQFNP